ncbi:MAG TPA: metallohydrolase [Steroidobacter sp.]|uniref:metallohydrolase n=1 Tax=Steroidobacter sp. TaxID=1978227 RepID=UPI002EDA749D
MSATIEFFPVGNGDMTLLTLESGRTILVDVNIRKAADDESDDEAIDVAKLLKDRLERDANGRLYVDALLLTHPDKDHCSGLERHFHLGPPQDWSKQEDKILIREMWSSPIIFRRKKDIDGALCPDAEAWWNEARRRVNLYKATKQKDLIADGDRIQVLGEDRDGKTDALTDILVKTDSEITKICGKIDHTFRAWLLAPQLVTKEEAETLSGKNHSSTVIRFSITGDGQQGAGLLLTGGDAEVENWERVWFRNKARTDRLSYDILLAPHHCSWHSLSYDSWSEKREKAKVSPDARSALSQARSKAFIVGSCNEIKDDDIDPPCIRAKREYEDIVHSVSGSFVCVADECIDDVLRFVIRSNGPDRKSGPGSTGAGFVSVSGGHSPREVEKRGGGRYAR